jgi:2',3'-cyclic-nucleotide 2'-phosphodiesterase (5'-nucleotidase family)
MGKFSFAILALLLVVLPACRSFYSPAELEQVNYRMSSSQDGAHPLDSLIAPYKMALDAQMNAVIGQVSTRLYKEKPESPLGNWVADALQAETVLLINQPLDASVQNYGGLRIPELPAGPVTLGKIYELMPFDNMQVIVEMDGAMVQRFFDHVAADGCWPVSKEVRFVLQDQQATLLTLDGKAVEPAATYRIAMPDYIANGGGDCDFLRELPQENTGQFVRDLLIRHVERLTEQGLPLTADTKEPRILSGE